MATKNESIELKKRWEREESKIVRPFKSADDYLRNAMFRLYADASFEPHPVIQVDSVDKQRLSPSIQLDPPPRNLEDLVGIPIKDITLLVSIEDRVLKNTMVLHNAKLAGDEASVIELGEEARECACWTGETRVHIAAVLSKSRNAAAGIAQRVGNWIAKKTFHVTRIRDNATFNIIPVDEEWFKSKGLPASTAYYVDMLSSDLNQPCESMPELVKVYMNSTIHSTLARNEDSSVTKAIIRGIYVDVAATILTIGYNNLEAESDLSPDSILGVVSKRLERETGITEARLMQYAKEGGGAQLRPVIQAEAEFTRSILGAAARRAA